MTEPTMSRTERDDFQETGAPALKAAADHGRSGLLDAELYSLWDHLGNRRQPITFTVLLQLPEGAHSQGRMSGSWLGNAGSNFSATRHATSAMSMLR